ncbi:polysaccharide pyruvyl transferase family protein [Clostridium chromiireducens]|uniref:Polysaccharide pyruvyl transferase family protein n=1 Tax=Clostridium chromiireducens TaxID=225345 RepID=A0A964RLU2_9CLOT|nr:polysaccharide pyruvyl transferase family protein [Clostridium chromiireducens]MVX64184.1 polysaccharide pyruvyl transferase family protein [Clostridium chromiireducens]
MKNTFLLVGNGPYENHGCEAIVRGTINILNQCWNDSKYIVSSYYNNSQQYINQKENETDINIKHIEHININKYSKEWGISNLYGIINRDKKKFYKFRNLEEYINNAKAMLSIGGDNYSLDYGIPKRFTDLDDYALSKQKPIVIWGASVGQFTKDKDYEKYMSQHLRKITAIFARESETVKYLESIGIHNNVYRVCDPAFMLEAKKPTNYNIEIEEGAIGINISPLMIKYVSGSNINEFIKLAVNVSENIIKSTGRKLYFIPHVVIKGNNDYEIMDKIYNNIDKKLRERIIKVSDKLNASEYKWIISHMEVFFGARTHATIASLSTLVPTLSFVYSIKSVGINKDLFGSDEFCVYPEQFNENILVEKIKYLIDNKEKIKEHLNVRVNESKKLSLKAGEHLKNIIG